MQSQAKVVQKLSQKEKEKETGTCVKAKAIASSAQPQFLNT